MDRAEVTVTIEIEARLPYGASEHVMRTVTENGPNTEVRRGIRLRRRLMPPAGAAFLVSNVSITDSHAGLTKCPLQLGTTPAGRKVTAITYRTLDEGLRIPTGETLRSHLGRELSDSEIQHDIYMQSGTSGSPLFRPSRHVIGVNLGYHDSGDRRALYLDTKDKLIRNVLRHAIDCN